MTLCKNYAAKIEELLTSAEALNGLALKLSKMEGTSGVIELVKEFLAFRSRFKESKKELIGLVLKEMLPDAEQQYNKRTESLIATGLIYELPKSKKYGFVDIEGKERIYPSWDKVADRLFSKIEIIKEKSKQGFVELQITPFGQPLLEMAKKVHDLILKKQVDGNLKAPNGDDLPVNLNKPLYVGNEYSDNDGADVSGKIAYYVKRYAKAHGGKTKKQLLNSNELLNGFTVILHEGTLDLPAEKKGRTKGKRKQLEANRTPEEHLNDLMTKPEYSYEHGYTPEDWLTLFATVLEEKNVVIDDNEGRGKTNCNLAGYILSSDDSPGRTFMGFWYRSFERAHLVGIDWNHRESTRGARTAVKL